MTMLNKTQFTIQLRRFARSLVELTTVFHAQGEPIYATDTKQLFMSDGTLANPVQTLDMAVCHDDAIVCHDDAVVYTF